MVKKTWLQEQS